MIHLPTFTFDTALSIISVNVNGLRDRDKRAGFVQWLRSLPSLADVVCLQECHCVSVDEVSFWFPGSGLLCAVSPGSNHSCGCIVLFRPSLSLIRSWSDDHGRFLQCEFSYRGKVFRVACVYAPNRNPEREEFYDDVCVRVDPSVPTVLCGDFNAVYDRLVDRVGSDPADTVRESLVALAHLFSSCCVTDIWRYLHPSTNSFTWSRWNGLVASRIDLIGCPYAWISSVGCCDILPFPFSDQCALFFSVSVPDAISPGPGLWKLNSAVLDEPEFALLISNFWPFWRSRIFSFSSLADWWDAGKAEIKRLSVDYCRNRVRVKRGERDLLSRLVSFLKEKLDAGAAFCLAPYHTALSNLGKFDLEAARGAQVRSRVRWTEEGEVSSAYFFRLIKKQSADRLVAALRFPDGTVVNSPPELVECFSQFYSDLFSAEPVDFAAQDVLLSNVSAHLSPSERDDCEGLLSVEECFTALQGMARRKAPGSDGLPMEFYLKFWSLLGSDLVRVLNSCFSAGRLSPSQCRSVISLSFKKGNRLDPKNWRPISLLNVDYKIASRAIAGRLLKVLSTVVDKDQTCGVPGRFIGENVAFLRRKHSTVWIGYSS